MTYEFRLTKNASKHHWSDGDAGGSVVEAIYAAAALLVYDGPYGGSDIIVANIKSVDSESAYVDLPGDLQLWAEVVGPREEQEPCASEDCWHCSRFRPEIKE